MSMVHATDDTHCFWPNSSFVVAYQKLRIKAEVVAVDALLEVPENLAERSREKLIRMGELVYPEGASPGAAPIKAVRSAVRAALLGDLLRLHSRSAAIIAVTLPLPAPNAEPGQYMSWLEVLSDELPPTVMLRGNNDNVMTFSS